MNISLKLFDKSTHALHKVRAITVSGITVMELPAPLIEGGSTLLEPTEFRKQPIRTLYLGHVTGYQPIRDQYFLIRSVPVIFSTKRGVFLRHPTRNQLKFYVYQRGTQHDWGM